MRSQHADGRGLRGHGAGGGVKGCEVTAHRGAGPEGKVKRVP